MGMFAEHRSLASVIGLAILVIVTVITLGSAGSSEAVANPDIEQATIRVGNQTLGNRTVIVDSIYVPDGGFVTLRDPRYLPSRPAASVLGASEYLEPGCHTEVTVTLAEPPAGVVETPATTTLLAVVHQDTDADRTFDFVLTGGYDDGAYIANGTTVTDRAAVLLEPGALDLVNASIQFSDQRSNGTHVRIDAVILPAGGFVVIHDELGVTKGRSDYLPPGVHRNVSVPLSNQPTESERLWAVAVRDTNHNRRYDVVQTGSEQDNPYFQERNLVADGAFVTVGNRTAS